MIFVQIELSISSWHTTSSNPPHPQLPRVCCEWQDRFSHENFRILVLDQDRLDDFKRYVCNNILRREHVRRIILRVKLPEYDCKVCQEPEDESTVLVNNAIFLSTVQALMDMLSYWGLPNSSAGNFGIGLDIGAYSPSDGQHAIRDCRFSPGYQYDAGREAYERHEVVLSQMRSDTNDPCPGWRRTCQGKLPLMGTKRRLLATLCDGPPPRHEMPVTQRHQWMSQERFSAVPRICALTIRRHSYRHISPRILSKLILSGMPNLRDFCHETWEHPWSGGQETLEREYLGVLAALPRSLSRLSLASETSRLLHYTPSNSFSERGDAKRSLGIEVFRLARRKKLTVLNLSFIADANEIMGFMHPGFQYLRRLTLTSESLRPWVTWDEDIDVLQGVGSTALQQMPSLEILEVWNQTKKDSFSMVVRIDQQEVLVSWYSSWHRDNALDAVWRWLRNASNTTNVLQGSKRGFVVNRVYFEPGVFNSWRRRGESGRPTSALHGVSKRQMEYEREARESQRGILNMMRKEGCYVWRG